MSDDAPSVPVSVLEALASEWERQAGQGRESERNAILKPGDGIRRAGLYRASAEVFDHCAATLREAMARSGQE